MERCDHGWLKSMRCPECEGIRNPNTIAFRTAVIPQHEKASFIIQEIITEARKEKERQIDLINVCKYANQLNDRIQKVKTYLKDKHICDKVKKYKQCPACIVKGMLSVYYDK